MKRQYDSDVVRDDVLTFTGIEVERTPCFGMKTYFVVGVPREEPYIFVNKVMKEECEQIYFGANHSLKNWQEEWTAPIVGLIKECLNAKFNVTIDVDPITVPNVIKNFLTNTRFSITYAVPIPNIDKIKGTVNIKLDDEDFEATNSGVWSTTIETIKVPNNYTGWDEYKKDKPL